MDSSVSSTGTRKEQTFTQSALSVLKEEVAEARDSSTEGCEEVASPPTPTVEDGKPKMASSRLTAAQRAAKVARYLDKKQRRQWIKKVQYQSRKNVADVRPRFKGRFVSEDKAGALFEQYWKETCERHKTERHFAVVKIDRKTSKVASVKFPNQAKMETNVKRVLGPLELLPEFQLKISSELGWKQPQP